MAQPTAYNKTTNFTVYAAGNPGATYPPALLDTELVNIETTLDAICRNLVLIQRDDGALVNGLVTLDSLSPNVLSFMAGATSAWALKGAWLTATAYKVYDVVVQSSNTYVCCTAHTSGTFATDLAAVKWILIAISTIADNSVSTAKIQDLAVTTGKLADLSVTTGKIAANAVTASQIAANAVGNTQMADGAIGIAELKAQTLGNMITYGTAGAPQLITPGTTRQVCQITATGTPPSFAGHGGDWGVVLGVTDIATTGAISVSLTNYPVYLLMFKGVTVDTDNVNLVITLSDDTGSTYKSGGYHYHTEIKTSGSTSYAASASSSAASILAVVGMGNASAENADLFIFIQNTDGNGSRYIQLSGWVTYRDTSTVLKGGTFIGGLDDANDITNMKVAISSGNLMTGHVVFYGIGEGI